jgi:hypothetical protein
MPHDIVILTAEPPTLEDIMLVAHHAGSGLEIRPVMRGKLIQLVRPGDEVLITFDPPQLISHPSELTRILPRATVTAPVWWTEAWVPFDTKHHKEGLNLAFDLVQAKEGQGLINSQLMMPKGHPSSR